MMIKLIFFWIIVAQFVVSFCVTILGVVGYFKIDDGILKALTTVLVIEQAGAVIAIFKATDFFYSKSTINDEGWDLLATLWKFQQQTSPNDPNHRWYMEIRPINPDFADCAAGYARLKHLGLIDINHGNEISLSNKGYQFCQRNEPALNKRKRLFHIA